MGITERKLRQREEVRASILKAAWEMVLAEGWQALSIRKIADAIEYSVPVIYDHFENKEAIQLEFTRRGFQLLADEMKAVKDELSNPEYQIEAMAHAYWNFAFNNKEYYQLMYGLGIPGCDVVNKMPEIGAFTSELSDTLKALIAKSKDPGQDPFLKLHTYWSALHGLVSINMMGRDNKRDEMNTMVLKDFVQGFISGIKG